MKTVSILLTILAILGLISVFVAIFAFKENNLMFLGLFISGSATITNWFVRKKYLSSDKST